MIKSLIYLRKTVMLSAAVSAAAIFLFGAPACAAEDTSSDQETGGISTFAVAPFAGSIEDDNLVLWWSSDRASDTEEERRGWFLFLPSDTDLNRAKIYYSAEGQVAVDGALIASGDSASVLTEGEHTLTCGEDVYRLTVLISANDPSVFITTKSGSLEYLHEVFDDDWEKKNREEADIQIYENGEISIDKSLDYISMRGNVSRRRAQKKPYVIKFAKKTEVLGLGKEKTWVLLSNPFDLVSMHNNYGWEFAEAFGLKYTVDRQHVDLYINGEYRGNYILCDKLEIGPDRVDIRNLEKENEKANPGIDLDTLPEAGSGPNGEPLSGHIPDSAKWVELPEEPEDISGGYLLEIQLAGRYNKEKGGFVTPTNVPVLIREPQHPGKSEVMYIWTVVSDAFDALFAEGGRNEKGKHYTEYIDMDSFVNMYILQELSKNIDAAQTSFYMYLDSGSDKLVFSPIWDMDGAFSYDYDRFETNTSRPDDWWANSISYPDPTVLTAAYKQPDFRKAVRSRWKKLLKKDIFETTDEKIGQILDEQKASLLMNVLKWRRLSPQEAEEFITSDYERMEQFVKDRVQALTKGFSENSAMLYYDTNGGSGHVYNRQIAVLGETVAVGNDDNGNTNTLTPPDESLSFAGWNTAPDGSGQAYQPGDEIVLNEEITTLYAMWE